MGTATSSPTPAPRLSGRNRRRSVNPSSPVADFCAPAVFLLVLFVLAVAPLPFGSRPPWAHGVLELAILIATGLWVLWAFTMRETQILFTRVALPVLLLMTYAIVNYSLAEVESIGRAQMMLYVCAGLLFFLTLASLRRRWQITAIVWILLGLGTLEALYGLLQVILPEIGVWWAGQYDLYRGQASGTFVRPSHLAAYLHLVFPMALANFLFARWSMRVRTLILGAGVITGAGILLSFSPSGWLGAIAAVLVIGLYLIRKRGYKFRWLVMGAALLGLMVLTALVGLEMVRQREHADLAAELPPLHLYWESALAIGRDRIWLGHGPDMFRWLFASHRTFQGQPDCARSDFLDLFANYGLIGCGFVLWVTIAFLVEAVQILSQRASRYSASTPSNRYAFAIGGIAALAATCVHGYFDSQLRAPANLLTLVVILAASLTCGIHARGEDDEGHRHPGRYNKLRIRGVDKLALIIPLLFLLALVGWRWVQTYTAYFVWQRAERAAQRFDWEAADRYFRQAWQYDGSNYQIAAAMGDFYGARGTWNLARRPENFQKALEKYNRTVVINRYAADNLIKMARMYDLLDKRDLALQRYQEALQVDPENATYHAQLGLHYQRWEQTHLAIASFERASALGGPDSLASLQLRQWDELE